MALLLNFAPIKITGETRCFAGYRPYSEEALRELRSAYYETHVFRRDHENDEIIDIPIRAGEEPLSDKQQEIDLDIDRYLVPMLLREALIRTFWGKRLIRRDRSAAIAVLGDSKRSLIAHDELPDEIRRLTIQQFEVRTLYPPGADPIIGIVCDVRTNNVIDLTAAELMERGVGLIGKAVQTSEEANDPRLMPWRTLVGRVCGVDGGTLELEEAREGINGIDASKAYLEARHETFNWVVRTILGPAAEGVLEQADQKASELAKGPGRRAHVEEMVGYLKEKANLELVPGATVVVGDLLNSKNPTFPPQRSFDKPAFLFDPGGTRKQRWAEEGLRQNGPYDQRWFSPKALKIAVVCQARYEGRVDEFIAKFLEGIPDYKTGRRGNERAPYGDGFIRRFKLDRPAIRYFTADGDGIENYVQATRNALDAANDGGFEWDIAIVQVEERFKALSALENPYFVVSSLLLKRQVPVQNVQIETMAQEDKNIVYTLNNLSLATYAKLKGVPWLLASSQTVARELVIGLGSHTQRSSRYGAGERYVGITSIFSSDGTYLLSDKTDVVLFDEYADALYESMARSIDRVRKQDNWRSTDKVRLVFHVFKRLKDTEVDAVKRTVERLDLDDVSFAFIHVAQDHPWLLFDLDQKGVGYYGPKKGVLAPSRGQYVKLGDAQALTVLSGVSELKLERHGMPRPVLLLLHRDSTFKDIDYLAQQIFEFAGHSWRVMSPESVPITIKYSGKIAQRLASLSQLPDWDPDAISFGRVGRSLWFL